MQETFNSLVRFSAAITVFGVQQVQTVVAFANPMPAVDKLREVIDGMTEAVSANIDEPKLAALNSISSLGQEVVDRTWENTTGMVKTTSGWLYGIVKAAAPVSSGPEGR